MKTIVLDAFGREDSAGKSIEDFQVEPTWNCRFHPTNWWHETGCPHKDWTKEELLEALKTAKQSMAWKDHIRYFPEDMIHTPKKTTGRKK